MIVEGTVKIYTGKIFSTKGPGRATSGFYNPQMVFSRDVMISFLDAAKEIYRIENALDALAATGIRGIRIAREVGLKVTINDWNEEAHDIIKKNVSLNGINAEITKRNANSIMAERRFGYIDIDPYGSPVPFLDMAVQSVKNRGIIGITATDTANLSGSNPRKCFRRYMARCARNSVKHEVGVRILLGYVGRTAAKYDKGILPLLSIYHGHHYRVFVAVFEGAKRADETLENINMAETPDNVEVGPVWIGKLHDERILERMKIRDYFQSKKLFSKMLEIWKNEKGMFFYELHYISSLWKINTPPVEKVMEELTKEGYYASRTQFSPTGIRTNASLDEFKKIVEKITR